MASDVSADGYGRARCPGSRSCGWFGRAPGTRHPVGVMTGVPIGKGVHADPVVPKPGDRVVVKPIGIDSLVDYGVLQVRTATVVVVLSGKFHPAHAQANTYKLSRYRIEFARGRGRAVG